MVPFTTPAEVTSQMPCLENKLLHVHQQHTVCPCTKAHSYTCALKKRTEYLNVYHTLIDVTTQVKTKAINTCGFENAVRMLSQRNTHTCNTQTRKLLHGWSFIDVVFKVHTHTTTMHSYNHH